MAAVLGHDMAYEDISLAPSEVQVLAHELEQEFAYASSAQKTRVDAAADDEAQRQQHLATAGQSMGLTMPAQGVQTPTLDFELDHFQLDALEELGQNTVSPNNTVSPSGRTSTITIVGGGGGFCIHSCGSWGRCFYLHSCGSRGEQSHQTWSPYFLCKRQHYSFSGK